MPIVWIDTETTGLVPSVHELLEVACIITDDAFNEVARYHAVTDRARSANWSRVEPVVYKMHHENGLWGDSIATGKPLSLVDGELAQFIYQHAVRVPEPKFDAGGQSTQKPPVKPVLAGSTVSFDRGFLQVHTPATFENLHYRNLDVTSVNELAARAWPEAHAGRPVQDKGTAHRAMPDIEYSLQIARYYVSALQVAPKVPA